nr:poly [ADP-ribose] polymerase 1 isoform X1 [Ipomoea batatas]
MAPRIHPVTDVISTAAVTSEAAAAAPVEITWQIIVGAIAGVTPFIVAGIDSAADVASQSSPQQQSEQTLPPLPTVAAASHRCRRFPPPQPSSTQQYGKELDATELDAAADADDVEGLESLRWEDQEKVRKYVEGGGCGSSNAPTPAAMEYGVETSQTSRATCKHCNEKIMKGEVRISSKAEGQGARSLAWHHAKCFMEKSPVTQVDKLLGWDSLPASDQAVVCSLVKNSTVKAVAKEEPLQESTSTAGAKRKKSSNNDQKSKLAKTEPDIVTKSSELESQLKAQSKALWALKDDLKKHVSTAELREMLECNDYVSTGSELDLRDRCADGMLFGALSVCPLCSGHLCYSEGKYKCHGYLSAWSKCSYSTIEPKRVDGKWKIPEETYLSTFIQLMKVR